MPVCRKRTASFSKKPFVNGSYTYIEIYENNGYTVTVYNCIKYLRRKWQGFIMPIW